MSLREWGREFLLQIYREQEYVYQFVVQPTSFCPAGCSYCYLAASELGNYQVMRGDVRSRVIHAIHELLKSRYTNGKIRVLLRGGEPLAAGIEWLEEFLLELYSPQDISADSITVSIQTNGWYLREDFISLFRRFKVEIGISVDGPEAYCSHRVDKAGLPFFNRIMKGVDLLRDSGYEFAVISVITADMLKVFDPDEYLDFFSSISPVALQINVEAVKGAHKTETPVVSTVDFWQAIYSRYKHKSYPFKILQLDDLEFSITHPLPQWVKRVPFKFIFPLVKLDLNPVVTHRGEVLFLSGGFISAFGLEDFVVASLMERSIIDIIKLAQDSWYVEQYRTGLLNCRGCSAFHSCGGGFSDARFAEAGNLTISETPACRSTILQALEAIQKH